MYLINLNENIETFKYLVWIRGKTISKYDEDFIVNFPFNNQTEVINYENIRQLQSPNIQNYINLYIKEFDTNLIYNSFNCAKDCS